MGCLNTDRPPLLRSPTHSGQFPYRAPHLAHELCLQQNEAVKPAWILTTSASVSASHVSLALQMMSYYSCHQLLTLAMLSRADYSPASSSNNPSHHTERDGARVACPEPPQKLHVRPKPLLHLVAGRTELKVGHLRGPKCKGGQKGSCDQRVTQRKRIGPIQPVMRVATGGIYTYVHVPYQPTRMSWFSDRIFSPFQSPTLPIPELTNS